MATNVAGPVLLPDGSSPMHGRVLFRLLSPIIGGSVVASATVIAPITAGEIDVDLQAEAGGTPYAVAVEHWSAAEGRLVTTPLPNVVPTGAAGPVTLAQIAAVTVPASAGNEASWKRGDTISIGGQWLDEHGRPLNLSGLTIAAALRGPDGVVRALAAVLTDAASGLIEISMTAALSAALPLGAHAIDVKITNGARVSRTQTGTIHIIPEVTP